MGNQKPIVVVTDNERIKQLVRSAVRPNHTSVICVSTLSGVVLPMTKSGISLVVHDLASRAISGDDLMAIARVAEGRSVPLIILTRQPRLSVKALAAVLGARDVISTTDSETTIAARLRLWMGSEGELDPMPASVGFSIVPAPSLTSPVQHHPFG
jgi:DNA-binding response OmpR family regulator